MGRCEAKLAPLLATNGVPDANLAHEIATAKVKAAAEARAGAAKAKAEAEKKSKDAQARKEQTAKRSKDATEKAKPRDVTVQVYSVPIAVRVTPVEEVKVKSK